MQYQCQKCQNEQYETDTITASGTLSKFFNVQNKKFTTVTCTQCGYTEFFKRMTSTTENIFDFFTN